ncbi:Predicted nucleic acid-binding protein, contains Zn-ribbon domain (includes truncated derivatives) [Quadrisphaera granulorum]|uniref:Putative nucleic acid-binding Zn ribbon protein n=1 Tax=Quadrisphaera granulorum TaxID=317664 RepID=A0A316AD97_9ACTN|nr:DciA family protein [Quadrisphaera granulorum]PWJ55756.1 putative nucleic acid-binding Zn ribbon protein [Quadrisphaera granulorum]SZE95253.1 Predicted nucleic acid-binding protein, contains Zn-ribbon domain (includes truncated derivatives) [Quadrisphaera granulorum]
MPGQPGGPRGGPSDDQQGDSAGGPPVDPDALPAPEELPDAAATALHRARAAARARGARPGRPGSLPPTGRSGQGGSAGGATGGGAARGAGGRDSGRTGARPDARDPQTVASSIGRLVSERGWRTPVAIGGVMGRWADVVGAEVAAHCQPETFSEGELVVRADSTAWATQVRMLTATVLRRLGEELGEGVVTRLVVRGPAGPSWRAGSRSAGGRGPRDTYG